MKNHITNVNDFYKMKEEKTPISVLTCYDFLTAKIMKDSTLDCVLVGDSVGMVFSGYENTIPVTIDEIIYHTKAVRRGFPEGFIVSDMPFMSYQISPEDALFNAGRLVKEGGANAVKLEGGIDFIPAVEKIVKASIPVMGHLGLTPQSIHKIGGYRLQGNTDESARAIMEDSLRLEKAGAFAIVLEKVPEQLAGKISESLKIPTIGIGAGRLCDGQVIVINDLLGMDKDFNPKYVKKYAGLYDMILRAVNDYSKEVKSREFPTEKNIY